MCLSKSTRMYWLRLVEESPQKPCRTISVSMSTLCLKESSRRDTVAWTFRSKSFLSEKRIMRSHTAVIIVVDLFLCRNRTFIACQRRLLIALEPENMNAHTRSSSCETTAGSSMLLSKGSRTRGPDELAQSSRSFVQSLLVYSRMIITK